MIQRTFPVTIHRSAVIITNTIGQLHVQPWPGQEILVEAEGEVGTLKQEEDQTLIIADCQCDLVLYIPAVAALTATVVATDIIVNRLQQEVSISGANNVVLGDVNGTVLLQDIRGDVELADVSGAVSVTNIGGNLYARHLPRLDIRYVGGNTMLSDVAQANLCAVGGDLTVIRADSVTCDAVGCDLQATSVVHELRCHTIDGHCTVQDCAGADVDIHTIGEDFICAQATLAGSGVVGGNLHLQSDFSTSSHLFYHVGGDAHIGLPAQANLTLHTTVGGSAHGPLSTYVRNGGFITLFYGEGATQFDLIVDGDLVLSGAEPCHSGSAFSWDGFGLRLAELG
jgi:hypothetical protein